MGPHPQIEPPADMRAFARVLRQMFVALEQEGFTTVEAIAIVGHVIAANTGTSRPE